MSRVFHRIIYDFLKNIHLHVSMRYISFIDIQTFTLDSLTCLYQKYFIDNYTNIYASLKNASLLAYSSV